MPVYILTIVFLIIIHAILNNCLNMQKAKLAFVNIATIDFILLSGLRHITIGADTMQYKVAKWDDILNRPWGELFKNWWLFIRHGYKYTTPERYNVEEPLYSIFQKFCQIFTHDYQVYLIIVAAVFMIPMAILIYKYSEDVLTSYILFLCLFWNFFGITGIAQTLATAITAFGGFGLLKNGKWIRYILLVFLASFFHKSAFLALILLPIVRKKITKLYCILVLLGFGIFFVFRDFLFEAAISLAGYKQYQGESFRGYNFLLIYTVIVMLMMWKSNQFKDTTEKRLIYNGIFCGLLMIPIGGIGIRGAQYFSIYLVLILPNIICHIFKYYKENMLVKSVTIVSMSMLFFKDMPNYKFFWQ